MRVKELFEFIRERHAIYERRAAGKPKPWTKDPILRAYRFCNVYRELDTVTVWIRDNWRKPYDRDPNLWFAMVVARLVNWPESLDAITPAVFDYNRDGSPIKVVWDPVGFVRVMDARKKAGEKVFTGAYMIHAGPAEGASKAAYLAREVLTPMWERREEVSATHDIFGKGVQKPIALFYLHKWLMTNKDMGSFMAGQVAADVKFQTTWLKAKDWWTFTCPGPGSQRGLARVYNEAPDYKWNRPEGKLWLGCMHILQDKIDPLVDKAGMPRISAQDLQNCLCEFDKYERVRLGEGRPRSLYDGG